MSGIRLEDEVLWTPTGDTGRVIGLTREPSAVVEFSGGRRITIGLSKLEKVESPLPTEPGAVIQWKDDAYLPQIAQLDPGDRHLGWWAPDHHGDPRWMTAEQLQRRIGSGKWTLLEPRAETAKAVLGWVQPALPDHWYRDARRTFGVDEDAVAPGVTS